MRDWTKEPIRLFVGWDAENALAPAVFASSVQRRASEPVSVTLLALKQLRGFRRPREEAQSTEFAFTRFLVPWLCGYKGWAIYADGDMVCRADIAELWKMRDKRYAVRVVKREGHGMTATGKKFLGREQTSYARKNWSSVMLMNCEGCVELTKETVEMESGLYLHQFRWLDDSQIGGLESEWNHLVGVDALNPSAKIAHFTLGMPAYHGLRECEFAGEWRAERDAMLSFREEAVAIA